MTLNRHERVVLLVVAVVVAYLAAVLSGAFDAPKPTRPSVVAVYEDGSGVLSDGTTFCQHGGLCERP